MPRAIRIMRGIALREQGYRCFYCKEPLKPLDATADHKHPIGRRGKTYQGNIVASCRHCNETKATLFDAQFFGMIGKKKPPKSVDIEVLMVWATRRIWRRTHKACERIERFAGVSVASSVQPNEGAHDPALRAVA